MGTETVFTGLKRDALPVRVRRKRGELLSIQDVAKHCGCSEERVRMRLRAGMLPERVRVGKLWYWTADQLEEVCRVVASPWPYRQRRYVPPRKLSPDDERELLSLRACGLSQAELAKLFRLSQGQVSRILTRLRAPAVPIFT